MCVLEFEQFFCSYAVVGLLLLSLVKGVITVPWLHCRRYDDINLAVLGKVLEKIVNATI